VTSRRRLLLTLHVSSSASNLGATVLTLALLVGAGVGAAPSSSLGTLCVYGVLVPLLVAGLLTGVVSALTSPWGLFRHGWVVKKLLLTLAAIVVGLAVVGPSTSWPRFAGLGAVLALLLLTTTLSVFKPKKGRRVPA
jgi:hypothetical protein